MPACLHEYIPCRMGEIEKSKAPPLSLPFVIDRHADTRRRIHAKIRNSVYKKEEVGGVLLLPLC